MTHYDKSGGTFIPLGTHVRGSFVDDDTNEVVEFSGTIDRGPEFMLGGRVLYWIHCPQGPLCVTAMDISSAEGLESTWTVIVPEIFPEM